MDYKFYIQKYPQGTNTFTKQDVEAVYGCRYRKFENIVKDGDVQNVYTESFAERSGDIVYIPDTPTMKSYDCTLTLLFKGKDCQKNVRDFTEYVRGKKIEWSDNFRNRYATLVMTKAPTVNSERLYGDSPFKDMTFTFTNILGTTFSSTQIK